MDDSRHEEGKCEKYTREHVTIRLQLGDFHVLRKIGDIPIELNIQSCLTDCTVKARRKLPSENQSQV